MPNATCQVFLALMAWCLLPGVSAADTPVSLRVPELAGRLRELAVARLSRRRRRALDGPLHAGMWCPVDGEDDRAELRFAGDERLKTHGLNNIHYDKGRGGPVLGPGGAVSAAQGAELARGADAASSLDLPRSSASLSTRSARRVWYGARICRPVRGPSPTSSPRSCSRPSAVS